MSWVMQLKEVFNKPFFKHISLNRSCSNALLDFVKVKKLKKVALRKMKGKMTVRKKKRELLQRKTVMPRMRQRPMAMLKIRVTQMVKIPRQLMEMLR